MANSSDNLHDTKEDQSVICENSSQNINGKTVLEDSGYKSFRINITNSSTPMKPTNKKVTWGSERRIIYNHGSIKAEPRFVQVPQFRRSTENSTICYGMTWNKLLLLFSIIALSLVLVLLIVALVIG